VRILVECACGPLGTVERSGEWEARKTEEKRRRGRRGRGVGEKQKGPGSSVEERPDSEPKRNKLLHELVAVVFSSPSASSRFFFASSRSLSFSLRGRMPPRR
jgi:hypothetical protein